MPQADTEAPASPIHSPEQCEAAIVAAVTAAGRTGKVEAIRLARQAHPGTDLLPMKRAFESLVERRHLLASNDGRTVAYEVNPEPPASPDTPSPDDAHLTARQVLKAAREYLEAEAAEWEWRAVAPRYDSTGGHERVAESRAERTRMAVDQFEHVLGRYVDARIRAALPLAYSASAVARSEAAQ